MKKIRLFLVVFLVIFAVSCKNNDNSILQTPTNTQDTPTKDEPTTDNIKLDYDMSKVKFESKTITYDGMEHELVIDGKLPDGVSVFYSENTLTDVGSIQVTAMFEGDYENYNEIEPMVATLTIVKADIEGISFTGDTVTYDGVAHSLRIDGELPDGVFVTYENNEQKNAGVYTVKAIIEDKNENYNSLTLEATLTINKADYDMSNVTFDDETVTYDGYAHKLEINGRLPLGVSVSYTNNELTNAGSLEVTATFTGDFDNYNEIAPMTATLTVVKADIEGISLKGNTVTYDGGSYSLSIEGKLPNGVSVRYENNDQVNAGVYIVKAILEDTNGNYNPVTLEATLTINKADYNMSGVQFNDAQYTYDGNPHTLVISGILPEGVSVSYTDNELKMLVH